jgi:hypothetical protein
MTLLRIGSIRQRKVSECQVRKLLKQVRDDDAISELFFYNIDFTERIQESMRKLLIRDGRRFYCIKLLSCSGNLPSIIDMIMDHSSSEALTLSHAELPTLQAVNAGLRTNQSLRVLRISAAAFLEDCLEGLNNNCTLQVLDLCGSHLSETAIDSLSRSLLPNRKLKVLRLNDCDIEDHAMAEVIECLLGNDSLQELELSNNGASNEALEMITALIQRNNIEKLGLSSLRLSKDLDQTILYKTIKSLKRNTSLSYLDISGNHFFNDAIIGLAESLCENSTLQSLDISNSHITECGIKAFAKYLPQFKGLSVLSLAENDITEDAVLSLVDGLEHNRILFSLGPIEEVYECSHIIEHYLDLNMAGRRALQNDISLSIWPHLLARTAQAKLNHGRTENCLYSLLRGPALFEG